MHAPTGGSDNPAATRHLQTNCEPQELELGCAKHPGGLYLYLPIHRLHARPHGSFSGASHWPCRIHREAGLQMCFELLRLSVPLGTKVIRNPCKKGRRLAPFRQITFLGGFGNPPGLMDQSQSRPIARVWACRYSKGTPIPAQWACRRRCRDTAEHRSEHIPVFMVPGLHYVGHHAELEARHEVLQVPV